MCHGYYQKAAWVWKVTLHLPHEELECEKDRLMGLTQLSVSLQCLHWESLLSYQHQGMQACQSLLSYCSDHTGKRQLFSEMKCGVTAAVFFIQYL